ncbi:hypothetical protein LTR62_007176 [Meristemomyces frigidus]|uniref:AB hydrolase-1 domain-containing protein n=1 Tax=Meristemomyces frigidus TaxID=1508187 RepID=A0AAN7YDZ1_9PEZI|nr:hypothetical protein LTR62_007176 [Meristemomyces frigidus]
MPDDKKTLLLVFIHGFKGNADTFSRFPQDLANLLSHTLPKIAVKAVQYPPYDTRGDLAQCVAHFLEWLQNLVIELEVKRGTKNAMGEAGVRVVLCGHSMGGIVAVEAVLSILHGGGEVVQRASDTVNSPASAEESKGMEGGHRREEGRASTRLDVPGREERAASAPPALDREEGAPGPPFFPYIQAVLAFDTPFLGISPGVLAHGAEEHLNTASSAYKAFGTASSIFGWNEAGTAPQPIANTSSKGLPAPNSSNGWGAWGKYAMYGGAAAALAGAAGAAYINRNQITQGLTWAGSHLEFVGCLARGAELQKRVERMVETERTKGVGFGNFYGVLGAGVEGKTKYAGEFVGKERTFCVIPTSDEDAKKTDAGKGGKSAQSSAKSSRSSSRQPPASKERKQDVAAEAEMAQEMNNGEEVHRYAKDATKGKGDWIKCVNGVAQDEVTAHRSMFAPARNPDYHAMTTRARDWLEGVVEEKWYESSGVEVVEGKGGKVVVVGGDDDGRRLEGSVEMLEA